MMFRRWRELFRNVPVEDDEAAVEEIAQRVVRERMGPTAILFLESSKPLSFIASQGVIAATPFVGGFIEPMRLEKYAEMFGNRAFVERVIQRIEELEAERAGDGKQHGEQ